MRYKGDKPLKRITFVIDKTGVIRLAYFYTGKGDVASHATEALAAVKSLG